MSDGTHAQAKPRASQAGQVEAGAAPTPKTPTAAATQTIVPTADQLIAGSAKPSLDGADTRTLLNACAEYVDAVFEILNRSLVSAVGKLRELPPQPDPSYAERLLEFLVETISGFAVGLVAFPLVGAARKALGELAATTVQNQLRNTSKTISQSVGSGFAAMGTPSSGRQRNTVRLKLIEEFSARQTDRLIMARADARVAIELMASSGVQVNHQAVSSLALELQATTHAEAFGKQFEERIAIEWLNLSATLSLGQKERKEDPDFAGANDLGGSARSGIKGIEAWGGGEGFLEIAINLPDEINGTQDLEFSSAEIPGQPGTAEILRKMNTQLSAVAVYRLITLALPGQGPLGKKTSVAISPDGRVESKWDDAILVAIGRNSPISSDEVWHNYLTHQDGEDGEDAPTRSMRGSVRRGLDATYATQGATMIVRWLASFNTSSIKS